MKNNNPKGKCYSYIRLSTPEQLEGHGLPRQIKKSNEYAKKHGLILDNSLKLSDLGLSAFHGEHTSKGKLGQFLKLVEGGYVEKGSTLLVESLDRLSRVQVLDALDQIRSLTKRGIKIVTLIDEQEYTEETLNTNFGQLIISLTIMSRAHEESLTKSKRLSAAWKEKRKIIKAKKITSKCPAWLKFEKQQQLFVEIPVRCNLVRLIFDMYLSGKGATIIVKEFNRKAITPWGRSKSGWHTSYIRKILKNRSVLGEFQPHKIVNGKRTPVDDPVSDYFPRLIDDKIFYRVQEKLEKNTLYKGKTGFIHTLFGGLTKCGYCGTSMAYVNKGKPPKGGRYLVCDAARRGGCMYRSIRYDEFEKAILTYCIGLDVEDLLNQDEARKSEIHTIANELIGIQGQIKSVDSEIENLTVAIATTNDDRVRKQLDKTIIEKFDMKDDLNRREIGLTRLYNRLTQTKQRIHANIKDIKKLFDYMSSASEEERINLRLKIRNSLRDLIDVITVFPAGYTPEVAERFKSLGNSAIS